MNGYCLLFALLISTSLYAGPLQYRCNEPGGDLIIVEVDMNTGTAAFSDTYKIVKLRLTAVTSRGHAEFFSGGCESLTSTFHFDFAPTLDAGTLTIVSEVSSPRKYALVCEPTDDISLLGFFRTT